MDYHSQEDLWSLCPFSRRAPQHLRFKAAQNVLQVCWIIENIQSSSESLGMFALNFLQTFQMTEGQYTVKLFFILGPKTGGISL